MRRQGTSATSNADAHGSRGSLERGSLALGWRTCLCEGSFENRVTSRKKCSVSAEHIDIVDYNSVCPALFQPEKNHLQFSLPQGLLLRIEHLGSTSVPGLSARPIVDRMIEISDEERGRRIIPNRLEPQGYDCFWRPLGKMNVSPFLAWCIKRDGRGLRTHHLHFGAVGFRDKELFFRDILIARPDIARQCQSLKRRLCEQYRDDRIAYTGGKGEFIGQVLEQDRGG